MVNGEDEGYWPMRDVTRLTLPTGSRLDPLGYLRPVWRVKVMLIDGSMTHALLPVLASP